MFKKKSTADKEKLRQVFVYKKAYKYLKSNQTLCVEVENSLNKRLKSHLN